MNSSYQEARKLFPNMPEEIFELWLDERIDDLGWPIEGTTWENVLRNKSLDYWQRIKWRKQRLLIEDLESFTECSKNLMAGLSRSVFLKMDNEHRRVMGDVSDEKVKKIRNHLAENSVLPGELILIIDDGKYEIVDGSHRLVTLFWDEGKFTHEMLPEIWVGEI
jgi:hypothetical protein